MVSRNLRFRFTLDLEWPKRGHRIVSELLDNQADIICLQEVESDHLQSLYRPKLARYGYECLYKKKTGYKIDGCAIFYKSKLFQLLNYKGIEFNRINITNLLNRDNVGIIAVLKPKLSTKSKSSRLVIANTHLIFNPKRSDIRLAQLKYFLSELEELSLDACDSSSNRRCHHPTILCGDLNSEPDSDVSKFILGQTIDNTTNSSSSSSKNSSTAKKQPKQLEQKTTEDNVDDDEDYSTSSEHQLSSSNDNKACVHHHNHNHHHRAQHQQQPQQEITASNNNGKQSSEAVETSSRSEAAAATTRNAHHGNSDDDDARFNITSDDSLKAFLHSLQFKSVYPIENGSGQRYVSTFSSCIVDYIFYTPKKLSLESYRELLTEEQLDGTKPLPNAQFPSDHFSLEAKFTLK